MSMPKPRYVRKCAKCTDNRKRKLYYCYPLPEEEGQYHNPWHGELRCGKHMPDPYPAVHDGSE